MSWNTIRWTVLAVAGLAATGPVAARRPGTKEPVQAPPPPTAQADPADSLYRAALSTLSGRNYRSAAELFGAIETRFAKSQYAPDALYWQAFALYRLGTGESLRRGLTALRTQRTKYPSAATRGDAAALEQRLQGELARRGDPAAAAAVAAAASRIAVPPAPPAPPSPPRPPRPPAPPAPPAPHGRIHDTVCGEDDDDMKVAALNALQQMDAERAAPVLRKVLSRRDSGSTCLRRKAVFLVAQQQPQGAEETLLDAARNDPDSEVREQAVFWLSQVGTEHSVAALDSIVRTSTDPNLQEKAVFALSQEGSATAMKALRAYAERADVSEEAREKAIFWIGQTGTPDNAAFLQTLYGRLQNEELKKKVLFSISQMDTKEGGRWLINIARNEKETAELRKQALFWAEQCEVPTSEFAGLYSASQDHAMREQVIFVLSQRGDKEAADKLVEIAKADPDRELRKKALFWLGQMDDPRVTEVLQQILDQ
ncbi:MAG TPA: HEAT repeat domain-containing protein [Gemmatimonadales bacterium]